MTDTELTRLLAGRDPGVLDARSCCGILVPLIRQQDGLHLLYEVRASTLHSQPGEVCFPGGRAEPGEAPLHCALRETQEELGIPPQHIRVLGALDFVPHRNGRVLYPFLALIGPEGLEAMSPNAQEVDRVFTASLSALNETKPHTYHYTLTPNTADFPCELANIPRDYPWAQGVEQGVIYRWQDFAIWGLTGRITRHVLNLINESGVRPDGAD